MSVDTKGLIRPNTTISELESYMKLHYQNVSVTEYGREPYNIYNINFNDGVVCRNLSIILKTLDNNVVEGITLTDGVWLSLGCWGNSVEIIKGIASYFGGCIDENDCDEEPYYWVDKDKYFENIEMTLEKELELLLGVGKVQKVLDLITKYN